MEKTFEDHMQEFIAQAKALGPETNKPWRVKNKCSLFEIINTKEKADDLMRQLRYLQSSQAG